MAGNLVTWEKVKLILNLDDDQKELVQFLIAAASTQAEKIADRILAAQDIDIKLDSNGGREYLLPSYPVNRTDGVKVADNDAVYNIKAENGILRFFNQIPSGWSLIHYKGNIGYENIPEDLQQAVIEVVSANIRRLSTSGGIVGIKSMTAGGAITTQYELDIPVSSRSVFMSYRGVRI